MFYHSLDLEKELLGGSQEKVISALVVLTPAESKRLIAKAVAALPEVKQALERGIVIIANGTTNAFVAEELLGFSVPKANYAAGMVTDGELSVNPRETRLKPYVLRNGRLVDVPVEQVLKEFGASDVFIKGANAVDICGNAGVLMANEQGGTIGDALRIVVPRGSHLIAPVGLEKLIPSVIKASGKCGLFHFKYTTGLAVGFMPLVTAQVVTEIQAFEVLARVNANHIASGGIGGSEGSVILAMEGSEDNIEQAFSLIKEIKGEPPVPKPSPTVQP